MRFRACVQIRETLEEMGVARESFDMKVVRESGLARSLGGGVLAGALALGGLASAADQPSDSTKAEHPAVKMDDREMQKKKEKEDREMQKKKARKEMDARANGTWKGEPPRVRQRGDMKKVGPQDPAYLEMVEMMKNNGWWYGPDATEKLKAAAEAGDEWAMREIKWPEGHKFHKKGRPYFRNDGPHPKGLFPYRGLQP